MSKYSSFKSHQLITEDWRKFLSESGEEWYGWQESKLGKARKNPKPEEEEKEPSSLVKTLMIRGGLTKKQAEVMAKRQVELEEAAAAAEELEEGFPQPDPDYNYKERKASGRLPKTEPFPMPPGRTEAQDIYFGTGPESEDILAARKIYMKLEDGDPREEAAREALLGVIQQAVGDNEDLFAQVVAVMEQQERYAR